MAELVDALGSGPSSGNGVWVRVSFWAVWKSVVFKNADFFHLVKKWFSVYWWAFLKIIPFWEMCCLNNWFAIFCIIKIFGRAWWLYVTLDFKLIARQTTRSSSWKKTARLFYTTIIVRCIYRWDFHWELFRVGWESLV